MSCDALHGLKNGLKKLNKVSSKTYPPHTPPRKAVAPANLVQLFEEKC